MTLPRDLVPNDLQRSMISNHITALNDVLNLTPAQSQDCAKQSLTAVAKMLMVLPAREAGEHATEARGEAYMMALDDIPSWAVQEAVRRWYRGECGSEHDYKWQPGPFVLRKIASSIAFGVWYVRNQLEKALIAVPLVEFGEEHRESMKERARAIGLAVEK